MSKTKAWMTNTEALYSTHKKATSNQLPQLMELTFCNAIFNILKHKFATPVSTFFLFYSHTRELVIDCFQSQDFQFSFDLTFFSFLCFFTSIPNPRQSTVIVQGREEGVHFNKTQ